MFVEGASDRAALLAAADVLGVDLDAARVGIVPMEGFTGIGRFLATYGAGGRDLVLAGLCDEAESGHVARHLDRAGLGADPEAAGFAVCRADLEDELIRAAGTERVRAVLDAAGDGASYARFRRQPAQRDRDEPARLRRFLGTRSGRKIVMADALTRALAPDEVPAPLRAVLGRVGPRA